jgi:protein-S-isoprenylcysteine O-methyltransferase Ste14
MPRPLLAAKAATVDPSCRRLTAIEYSAVYDWATRLIVALMYAVGFFGNVFSVVEAVTKAEGQGFDVLNIAARVSSAMFVALAAVTVLTRLPPLRKAAGVEARVAALLGTFPLTAFAFLPRTELNPVVLTIAWLFVVVGMLMSVAVLRWLGKAFSIMAEARRLVTHGPYRFIRHPLYVCEEIAVIGIFIQVISPLAVLILIAHGFFQVRRMLNEERVLRAAFPEYEDYARRTPRLVPRLLPRLAPKTPLPVGRIRSAA